MKIIYWLVFFSIAALAVLGMSTPPQATKVVSATALDQWYQSHTYASIVIGILGGALAGYLAPRRMRLRPAESGAGYSRRVMSFGFWALLATGACVLLFLVISAYRASDWQTAPGDRIVLAWGIMRFWGALAAGVASAMILLGAVTFAQLRWNGRRTFV